MSRFIHNYIRYFYYVRKYYLDLDDISLDVVNIIKYNVARVIMKGKVGTEMKKMKVVREKSVTLTKLRRKTRANKNKTQANKLKCARPIKQVRFDPPIHHHYSIGLVKMPLILVI